LPGANGVVNLFVSVIGVVVDEEFRIIVFIWPWEDSE
jgi:hypothetical protein